MTHNLPATNGQSSPSVIHGSLPETRRQAPQPGKSGIAFRRIGRTSDVEICEMSNPMHIIRVTQPAFLKFIQDVRAEKLEPIVYGNIVVFQIGDPLEPKKPLQPMITSMMNWDTFRFVASLDIMAILPPTPVG